MGDYAGASEPELRASARAQLLTLIDRLELKPAQLTTERIDSGRFQASASLRGALRAHLDLAFRSASKPAELLGVATRGICRVAWHPDLAGFPIGVALALPASHLPRSRAELFADDSVTLAGAPLAILFALATNPARLGAGSRLIRDLSADCGQFTPRPRLVAFSPLTGLRVQAIHLLDDEEAWAAASAGCEDPQLLRQQISEALSGERLPESMAEPFASWLAEQARIYAHSSRYVVGRFHRRLGGSLIGIAHHADPDDPGSLWARALFDYLA